MDDYTLGKLVGFLRGLEIPTWVEQICDDCDTRLGGVVTEDTAEEVETEEVEENQEEDPEEEDETEESSDDSSEETDPDKMTKEQKYAKFIEMNEDGDSVHAIADTLKISVPTVYNWKAALKKASAV